MIFGQEFPRQSVLAFALSSEWSMVVENEMKSCVEVPDHQVYMANSVHKEVCEL